MRELPRSAPSSTPASTFILQDLVQPIKKSFGLDIVETILSLITRPQLAVRKLLPMINWIVSPTLQAGNFSFTSDRLRVDIVGDNVSCISRSPLAVRMAFPKHIIIGGEEHSPSVVEPESNSLRTDPVIRTISSSYTGASLYHLQSIPSFMIETQLTKEVYPTRESPA